ncbi:MAG TPA: hypothetical protein GX521_09415 [Firmicutes bacterium]|nr:hypothetical protein [Bacillota bacterium]
MNKRIETVQQVTDYAVDPKRRFFFATADEIVQGLTTDIYFVKTKEILNKLALQDTEVVAEIFPRRPGILVGVEEAKRLLKEEGVQVWSLPEGARFEAKEVKRA